MVLTDARKVSKRSEAQLFTTKANPLTTHARQLVNVGYSCYKLVAAVLLASFGLSATYWNAHSAFDTQPALLKLSATLKTASDGFVSSPFPSINSRTLLSHPIARRFSPSSRSRPLPSSTTSDGDGA